MLLFVWVSYFRGPGSTNFELGYTKQSATRALGLFWQVETLFRFLHLHPISHGAADKYTCSGTPSARDARRTFRDMLLRRRMGARSSRTRAAQHLPAPLGRQQSMAERAAERHGGEIKRRVLRELTEGSGVISDLDDLQSILSHMVVCKNKWYSRALKS